VSKWSYTRLDHNLAEMRSLPAINTSHEARQIGVSPPSLQAMALFTSFQLDSVKSLFERPQRRASHSRGDPAAVMPHQKTGTASTARSTRPAVELN
jgi:hypothetical protein